MTRSLLLQHLLYQARSNGFELRRWFKTEAAVPWPGGDAALEWLCQGSRVNLLLCSHSFAQAFFGGTERRRIVLPAATFERMGKNGVKRVIHRAAFARQMRHENAWEWHLQQLVVAPEPLKYAKRFLISAEMMAAANKPQPGAGRPVQAARPPRIPVLTMPDYDEELLVREN